MIFSLQRRFLLLLLLPVALILIAVGVGGFRLARSYLLDQWATSTQLKLEAAAHRIAMQLDEKLELINLIARAQDIPDGNLTQAFLIQQLAGKKGVRLVNIDSPEPESQEGRGTGSEHSHLFQGFTEGLYIMELCDDFGVCAPITDPHSGDRSLKIVKLLKKGDSEPAKRIVVTINFDSFLEPIKRMSLWDDSTAMLVTGTGQFLANTDKSAKDQRRLGDNGVELEKKVLKEIREKSFGTVWGKGHPPDLIIGFYRVPHIKNLNWYLLLRSKGSVVLEPIVTFREYYALAGVVSLVIILLLIRFTTRSVGRSIGEISAAAASVQTGDYTVKLPEDRSDEIGQLSSTFNGMVEGLKQRDLIEQTFGRYVDKKVAEELMTKPEALRLGGEKGVVSILMSDLRNFTGISEKMAPEAVIKMLNRYFSRMISVIEKYKGIIVDFYGDSILVFFDGVDSDVAQRAVDAVSCALEMQRRLEGFVEENIARGLPVLAMGIGVHTGEVIVGNIGTETRAKYGIVGANVNLTDRIQHSASAGKVVVSEETYHLIADRLSVSHGFNVCLKGIEEQKKLYEVESRQGLEQPDYAAAR